MKHSRSHLLKGLVAIAIAVGQGVLKAPRDFFQPTLDFLLDLRRTFGSR